MNEIDKFAENLSDNLAMIEGNVSRNLQDMADGALIDTSFRSWYVDLYKSMLRYLNDDVRIFVMVLSLPDTDDININREFDKLPKVDDPEAVYFYLHNEDYFFNDCKEEYRASLVNVDLPDSNIIYRSWISHEYFKKNFEYSNSIYIWKSRLSIDGDVH